jgi:hypothetical protein
MKKLLLLLSVVIAGCGGGAITSSSIETIHSPQLNTVVSTVATGPLFESTPILLPDLRAKYDMLCGSLVNVQNAIAVDLNKDGKKDLVFNLWCSNPNVISYGYTINTMVALIQLPDGTFIDKSKEIFGSDMVDIGGVGTNYITSDFNSDGYHDIVITVNREDGRASDGGESKNMMSQTVAFMSDGNGHYSQIRFGLPKWGGEAKLVKDSNGKDMALILSAGYSNAEVWSFNGNWTQVTTYDWMQSNPVNLGSAIVNKYDNGIKLEIWNIINGVWKRILEIPYLSARTALMKENATSLPYQVHVVSMDGIDYIDGILYEGCALKRTLAGPTEVVYTFLGVPIQNGYTGQVLVKSANWMDSLPTVNLIAMGLTTENSNIKPITLNTDKLDSNFYHMECGDFNGDGLDDIFLRTTGSPLLYINDGNGNFRKVKSNLMPAAIRGASHIYVDIDGDGVKDVLFFPIDRWQFDWREANTYTKVQFQLYKGKRNVRSGEV